MEFRAKSGSLTGFELKKERIREGSVLPVNGKVEKTANTSSCDGHCLNEEQRLNQVKVT